MEVIIETFSNKFSEGQKLSWHNGGFLKHHYYRANRADFQIHKTCNGWEPSLIVIISLSAAKGNSLTPLLLEADSETTTRVIIYVIGFGFSFPGKIFLLVC